MGHQIIMHSELSWTGCFLTHQAIKLGVKSSTLSSNVSGIYMIRSEQAEGHMKKWPKCLWFPLLLHYLLSPSLHLWPQLTMGKTLGSVDRGREDLGLVYRWVCTICRYHPEVDSCSNTTPFWDIPEGQRWREIFPLGRTWSCASGCSLCLEGEMTRCVIIYWFMGHGQWFGWMVRDLEGTWLKKVGDKEIWGRGMWRHLWMGKIHENIYNPHECSPKGDLSRRGF